MADSVHAARQGAYAGRTQPGSRRNETGVRGHQAFESHTHAIETCAPRLGPVSSERGSPDTVRGLPNNSEGGRMRSLRVPGILRLALALGSIATAGEN